MRPAPRRAKRRDACPTGKRRFPDHPAAVAALHSAQGFAYRDDDATRRECRTYECDLCDGHHLTSQAAR